MPDNLKDLNTLRGATYKKNPEDEAFLERLNKHLLTIDQEEYQDAPLEHPLIFVFGAPRSGTTLLSQVIACGLDVSYVNNLTARFYLAPLTGLRLSKCILGENKNIAFLSNYARTERLGDIHEFGYFWRYWLKMESNLDVAKAGQLARNIDWRGLRNVLATLTNHENRGFVFKNIFGSYHFERMKKELQQLLFVYVERDLCDTAVSILHARKKYNSDVNIWWSYCPPEYEELKTKDYWTQIAGQVFYLHRYYRNLIKKLPSENVVHITYEELCGVPRGILNQIQRAAAKSYGYRLKPDGKVPAQFEVRRYDDNLPEKRKFARILDDFRQQRTI